MIYISSPYSHESTMVRDARVMDSARLAARLIRDGMTAYSPIAHAAMIERLCGHIDYDQWLHHCMMMLEKADVVYMLKTPGWNKSHGVRKEIEYAIREKKDVWTVKYPVPSYGTLFMSRVTGEINWEK